MRTRFALLLSLLLGLPQAAAAAPSSRYELGLRLRRFELALDQADPASRRRALPFLRQAVSSFFTMRMRTAGKLLDRARMALSGTEAPAGVRWAQALCMTPESRLIDSARPALCVRIWSLYDPGVAAPRGLRARLELSGGGRGLARAEVGLGTLPAEVRLGLARLPEGDHQLHLIVERAGRRILSIRQTLSVAHSLRSRLSGLAREEEQTVRGLRALLGRLARSERSIESDHRGHHLLREAERIARALGVGSDPFRNRPGSHRRWLDGRPIRLMAPRAVSGERPLPLVIALHGLGGSENMFFETYGAGKIVRLCRERGWLLVAPRLGFFGGLTPAKVLEGVARWYRVDRSRVYLIGHSMGAGRALSAVRGASGRFAAVAALGGGGAAPSKARAQRVAFFVGVGSRDFARGQGLALHRRLEALGARSTLKEYEVEHLGVVQLALPDVFAWLDGLAGRRRGVVEFY